MIAPALRSTQEAIAYGLGLASGIMQLAAELAETRAAFRAFDADAAPSNEADLEHLIAVGFRLQMLSEAHQAATSTGAIGEHLSRGHVHE